jgi:hypothetical protein
MNRHIRMISLAGRAFQALVSRPGVVVLSCDTISFRDDFFPLRIRLHLIGPFVARGAIPPLENRRS